MDHKMTMKFSVSDGYCGDVDIELEISSDDRHGHGGNHDPHVSIIMKFEQQHKLSVKPSRYQNDFVEVEMPTMKFEAWGCEGREIGNIFIKAGESINNGLRSLGVSVGGCDVGPSVDFSVPPPPPPAAPKG